jgi:hypothetical protein
MRVQIFIFIMVVDNFQYTMAQIADNSGSNDSTNIYFQITSYLL